MLKPLNILPYFMLLFGGGITVQPLTGQAGQVKTHVYVLADDSMAGRRAGSIYAVKAAEYIAAQFASAGIEPYSSENYFQTFNPTGQHTGYGGDRNNVVGIIPGSDPALRDEYIVLGAHFDHIGTQVLDGETLIFNGADDNASGTALLIEAARMIQGRRLELGRSVIVVAFDDEENGFIGSRYFTQFPIVPLNNIRAMVNADMVGWLAKAGEVRVYGAKSLHRGEELVTASVPAGLSGKVRILNAGRDALRSTDTYSFISAGIPSLTFTTGKMSPYHKPEDDAQLIDYKGLALITEHVVALVVEMSNDPLEAGKPVARANPDRFFEGGITIAGGSNYLRFSSGTLRGKIAPVFGAGLYGQMNLGVFAVRTGAMFERTGAQHPAGRIWENQLTVPLQLILQTLPSNSAGLFISAGGYYSYGLNGKQGGEKMDYDEVYERSEFGVMWGLGMRIDRVTLSVDTRYGITGRLLNDVDGANQRNRSTRLSVSYSF